MIDHLDNFPAGDFYLQMLVATLCAMVAGLMGSKRSLTPYDFAPWLRSPEERKKLAAAEKQKSKYQRQMIVGSLPSLKRVRGSG